MESKLIVQPAWEVYQDTVQADETKKEEALKEYARAVMENLIAAFGWFWIDILKKSRGAEWDGGDAFLDDFLRISVEEFVTKFADFKAQIWWTYLRLKRTDVKT
jgi:hypothetical protein